MKPVVHILATVRKPELLRAALLVFSTLRRGFPTADVCVWGNNLAVEATAAVGAEAARVGARFFNLPSTSHDHWIAGLIEQSAGGFWICDTDVVFHGNCELGIADCGLKGVVLAGRFEPEFLEEFTDTVHVARLHTCLMFINGPELRCAMRGWMARFPLPWRNSAQFDLVHQHFIPRAGGMPLFYDSMAGVYHSIADCGLGIADSKVHAFTAEEDALFDHLHFATYVDQVEGKLSGVKPNLRERFEAVYDRPELARGILAEQRKYYESRAVVKTVNAKAQRTQRRGDGEGRTKGTKGTRGTQRILQRVAVHGGDGAYAV